MNPILMCKDKMVMDIQAMEIFNQNLLPGLLSKNQSKSLFMEWFHKRYSERSNTASRQLRGILFGQGNRELINKTTHALSLSDCYWLKYSDENISFEDISPYCNNFWAGDGEYKNEAIPTLYVNGFLTKYWRDKNTLIKRSGPKEILCSKVAKALGINSVSVQEHPEGVAVRNFTSQTTMFESAEVSGRIDPENFSVGDILTVFGADGFDMIFLDALIGNGDRHGGNFGFLRNADTGEYVGMAPLFDYDHAYDSQKNNDLLIREVRELRFGEYGSRFDKLAATAKGLDMLDDYMRSRLVSICN